MEAKKLLTIALTGLLAGGCLMVPALAEDADGQSSGNPVTYTIPARVKRIEDYAFAGDTTLERVKIPDGVTEIGDYAFSGCTNLQEIELPDGLTKIGNHAFDGCAAGGHEPAGEHRGVCVQRVRGAGDYWGYEQLAEHPIWYFFGLFVAGAAGGYEEPDNHIQQCIFPCKRIGAYWRLKQLDGNSEQPVLWHV